MDNNETERQISELPREVPDADHQRKALGQIFDETRLYTKDGGYVVTIWLPKAVIPFEGIICGSRQFFYDPKRDKYFEGMSWYVVDNGPKYFFEENVDPVK